MILCNKGFKISNAPVVYELYRLLLPFLVTLLQQINATSLDLNLWERALVELLELFKGTVVGTHVNVFILDSVTREGENGSTLKHFVG